MRVGSLIGFWSLAFALGGCTGKSESDDEGPTLRQACLDSCDLATSCQPLPQDCDTTCETIERVYTGACASAATTLFECEATLSCSELGAYAEDYRSSPCGNEYDAFASACGYQPTPPAECEAFCANAELCAPGHHRRHLRRQLQRRPRLLRSVQRRCLRRSLPGCLRLLRND